MSCWPVFERRGTLGAVDRDEMVWAFEAFEREGLEHVLIGAADMGTVRPLDRQDAEALRRRFALKDE